MMVEVSFIYTFDGLNFSSRSICANCCLIDGNWFWLRLSPNVTKKSLTYPGSATGMPKGPLGNAYLWNKCLTRWKIDLFFMRTVS